MRVVLIGYGYYGDYSTPAEWLNKIGPIKGLMEALGKHCELYYIARIGYAGKLTKNDVNYLFVDTGKGISYFPASIHKKVKEINPDAVIVLGMHYPMQVMHLRRKLGNALKILVRHHGDQPPRGLKGIAQKRSDGCVDAYLFTTVAHAQPWINAHFIKNQAKIHEVFEASSDFVPIPKTEAQLKTGMQGEKNFLWVGRLNSNKDPMTVLNGFEKFLASEPAARLFMIFQKDDLIQEVRSKIDDSSTLKHSVRLEGFKPYHELPYWYSAADYFISGSHREAGGYAIMEAMSCGCIPVVTAIPSYLKAIENGRYGFSFEPGNENDLSVKLLNAIQLNKPSISKAILFHFQSHLSSAAIANNIADVLRKLEPI